jgi:protein TonB
MKLFICVLFFSVFNTLTAQTNPTNSSTQKADDNLLYSLAGIEEKPEYPGGINAFYSFIAKNFKAPTHKNFKGGKVFASFVIEKDGSLTEIKILRDAGHGTGEETLRVLQLAEKWKPATQGGVTVRCSYQIPIQLTAN